jgi:hypothetical protein
MHARLSQPTANPVLRRPDAQRLPDANLARRRDVTANQARPRPPPVIPRSGGPPLPATERIRHRRVRALGRTGRELLYAVLRAGLVAHLG